MRRYIKLVITPILLLCVLSSVNNSLLSFTFVIIHEIAHILTSKLFGSNFNNFRIGAYGSRVELIDLDFLRDKERLLIYISGPAINLIIVIIGYIISLGNENLIIKIIIEVNLAITLFNLLPAYPLDGARVLEILLSKKMIYKKANKIISIMSYLIGGFFIFTSIVIIFITKKYNASLTIAGIIIIFITIKENKIKMYIVMGNIFKKKKILAKNKYLENRTISVYIKQGLVNLMALVDKNRFNIFYVLDDDMKFLFIIYEDELIEALKLYGNITVEEYYKKRKEGY